MTFHCFLWKLKHSLAIPPLCDEHLKNLAFVIYCPPKIMCLAVVTRKNLVQMPAPERIRMVLNAPFSDLRPKHRAKTVPPEPYRLVADIDASFKQKILDLPQR